MQEMSTIKNGLSAYWKQVGHQKYRRGDNAVVVYDETTTCNTAKPWLPNHRGWMAYGPGKDEHNYLGFYRKNGRFKIPRKFKTERAAMMAVEKEFPI